MSNIFVFTEHLLEELEIIMRMETWEARCQVCRPV